MLTLILTIILSLAAIVSLALWLTKSRLLKKSTPAEPSANAEPARKKRSFEEDNYSHNNYGGRSSITVDDEKIVKYSKYSFILSTSLLITILIISSFTSVSAGYVGIIDTFGSVSDRYLEAGVHNVNPFSSVKEMSIKTEELKETMSVPSKEGLAVGLEASMLFSLKPSDAVEVYKTLGLNWVQVILEPNFRSICRGVTALYEAKSLYTADRQIIENKIVDEMKNIVSRRGILIEQAPLRNISLPQNLQQSIEEKLKADQDNQRMAFVLQKEEKEAQRKTIEARGIASFQDIVKQGINEQLLKWKGIEATEKLANSHNTKIIVIGGGKDGLPLILNGQ